MSLPLIPVMKYDLVKAAMASMLATERDNQLTLAAAAGKTEAEVANDYDFNVFKDLYRFPDASQLPAVNIRNHRGAFGQGSPNTMGTRWHGYQVAIECYGISTAEGDERSDKLAADRLDYLFAQVFHTFEAEENFHKGLNTIVRKASFEGWEQHKYEVGGSEEDTAYSILAISAIYDLQFEEPTEIISGVAFEELVANLHIREEFISPFVTIDKTGG